MRPFGCPSCRKAVEHEDGTVKTQRTTYLLIEATGRFRMRGHRSLPLRPYREAEVVHTLCGHIWWSKHPDAIGKAARLNGRTEWI